MGRFALKKDLESLDRVEGRAGADTVRLWDGYKEQAYMWRALALLQMPATLLSVIFAMILYFYADTIIEVPRAPEPGHYSVRALPDNEYINVAQEIVNLMASYQPSTARQQFLSARKFLWEPALSIFEEQMLRKELRTIEETGRSQVFFVNRRQIKVERFPKASKVKIRIPGTRQKLIGGRPLPAENLVYYVTLTTIPRNVHNPYGIVAIELSIRQINSFKQLDAEDFKEEEERKKKALEEAKKARKAGKRISKEEKREQAREDSKKKSTKNTR